MTMPDDVLAVDERLDALDDDTIEKAHSSLCEAPGLTPAQVQAHHALARQAARRGLEAACGEHLSKVKIAVDYETLTQDSARTFANAGMLDPDIAKAVDEFAETVDLAPDEPVGVYTSLTTAGYEVTIDLPDADLEMAKYNHNHDARGRFGTGGSKAPASGTMIDKVRANGGLTIRATGQEPKAGYIVAVRGHNREIPEADFFDPVKGPKAIEQYLLDKRDAMKAEPGQPGRWLGFWHDTKNGEVTIDVVEQHMNRDSAVKAGAARNQQAIWDVKNMAEIATGGTGDRADKSAAGHDGGGPGGLRHDDRRGDRGVRPQDVGAHRGGDAGLEAVVEKRTYVRDSKGRFATVGTGGSLQSRASLSHGSRTLTPADHRLIQSMGLKRAFRMDYNESYNKGVEQRDAMHTPTIMSQRHERIKRNLLALKAEPGRTFEAESYASAIVQDMGWIDGVLGEKRFFRRTLFGTDGYGVAMGAMGRIPEVMGKASDPIADYIAVEKFNSHHDSRGRFATHSGRSVPSVSGVISGNTKPDLIVVTDPYGDGIRLTKADSMYHHMVRRPDGSWGLSPERQALHDKIVADTVAGVPVSSNPTVYMLGGGPAAGKTTMLEKGGLSVPTTGEGGSKRMAVLVNADEVKAALPEYATAPRHMAAEFAHEESSWVSKRIQEVAIHGKRDVVLDGTGDSKPQKLAAKIQQARDHGYRVEGHYATVPTEMAVERARRRGERTGRVVPDSVVRGTHADVSRTFPVAHHLFDKVTLYDTTDGARKIAEGTHGSGLTILDQAAYAAFVDKGKE